MYLLLDLVPLLKLVLILLGVLQTTAQACTLLGLVGRWLLLLAV